MKNRGKKLVASLGIITILGTSLFTGAIAAGTDIKGKIANMTIFNNGAAISLPADQKPIIVNNRTYLPVRGLGEALEKEIAWSAADPNSVYITDKNQQDVNYLLQEMVKRQEKINDLEAKVTELEGKLKKQEESSTTTLSKMEKTLNSRNDEYSSVRFEISLYGNEKDIEVRVYESKNGYYGFSSLSSSQVRDYVKNIVDDIRYEFKDADVDGYIESSSGRKVTTFYRRKNGSLVVNNDYDYDYGYDRYYDLVSLENYLNDYYGRYEDGISSVRLYGDRNNISIDISTYGNDWYYLSNSQKKGTLEGMYRIITNDYPYAKVNGKVDNSSFEFDSNGNAYIY